MQTVITHGPSTRSGSIIDRLCNTGVDEFRLNLSHATNQSLEADWSFLRSKGILPALDTQGAQARIKFLRAGDSKFLDSGESVQIIFSETEPLEDLGFLFFCSSIEFAEQLKVGDFVRWDFGSLLLRCTDVCKSDLGFIVSAKVVTAGTAFDSRALDLPGRSLKLPSLSNFDEQAIISYATTCEAPAAIYHSFATSNKDIQRLRELSPQSRVVAKIESRAGLVNMHEIIDSADAILVDRGDMSREFSIALVPEVTSIIVKACKEKGKPVFVATNVLDSMMNADVPSRAEISDIWNLLRSGVSGLVLAAEAAIGKHPVESAEVLRMMYRLYGQSKNSFAGLWPSTLDLESFSSDSLRSWF